jgi:hypothetical protein
VSSSASGTGSATIGYVAAGNAGAARSANLTIGGQTFLVSQAAATVTASPVPALNPGAIDFGSVTTGKRSTKSAMVTNAGAGMLTITSLSIGGANPGDFTRSGTCAINTALSAGQSCTLGITFSPKAAGTRSASLAAGTSAGTLTLALVGTGKQTGRK